MKRHGVSSTKADVGAMRGLSPLKTTSPSDTLTLPNTCRKAVLAAESAAVFRTDSVFHEGRPEVVAPAKEVNFQPPLPLL